MDAALLAFIAIEATAAAIAIAVIWARGGSVQRLRAQLGGRPELPDAGVRALAERVSALEARTTQLLREIALLADLSGVGVVRLDDDSRVDFANLTAHGYFDRAPGTMIGQTAIEAFIDRRIEEVVQAARETGFANTELTLRSEGPTFTVRGRRSSAAGVWLVLQDVSELRRLQRIRTEFIDNLSHELRTPLSTISLLSETLARESDQGSVPLPPKMRDRVAKIEVETGHLVQMVSELLDLSRIESGGPIQLVHDLDLARVATASADRLRLFAERQGVELRVEAPTELPPVRGDEDRLGQVLVNLLHNAVKFSPDGGVVTVRVRTAGEEVVTSVEDHGIGIPKAALGRIFERFYKVDRARVRGGGTGLGLSIARNVVQGHGGRIWVESNEGEGSTFSFGIPIHRPAA